MLVSIVEKPYDVASAGWDFKLRKILSKADSDNHKALEEFEHAEDGGEKVDVLYALRDQAIRSTEEQIDRLIHEIEDYGPGREMESEC